MANRKHGTALVGLAALALALPAWAQSLDEVEKKIIAAGEKVKSLTADMLMESQVQQSGMTMEHSVKGTMEFMRKGDKVLWRMEQKTSTVIETAGQKQKMEQATLTIADGEFIYVLTERSGQKTATKSKHDQAQTEFATKEMFDQLRKDNTLKLLPEEQVDGKQAYVIAATPKKQTGPLGKQMYYFDKDCRMLVKLVALDGKGKPAHTTTFSNLKLNAKFKPERFKFKAPEGVEVIDMTKGATPKP